MDIKKLELLADVAETRNFTKTGDRTGYTQSGVSHILKALENELGFPLFIRTKKGVALTSDAMSILPYVRELLRTNEQLEQTIASLKGLAVGHLTIGTFASVSIHWLPPVIRRFRDTYPNISIQLKEGGAKDIEGWLEQGIADIGFFSKRPSSSLEWFPLMEDRLMAVLPLDFPIEDGVCFPLSRFQDYPFIKPENGYDYDIENTLARFGVKPNIQFTSMNDYVILAMVSSHLGISLMPSLVLKGYEHSLKIRDTDPPASRILGIAMQSGALPTPAAKEFIRYAKETILHGDITGT